MSLSGSSSLCFSRPNASTFRVRKSTLLVPKSPPPEVIGWRYSYSRVCRWTCVIRFDRWIDTDAAPKARLSFAASYPGFARRLPGPEPDAPGTSSGSASGAASGAFSSSFSSSCWALPGAAGGYSCSASSTSLRSASSPPSVSPISPSGASSRRGPAGGWRAPTSSKPTSLIAGPASL